MKYYAKQVGWLVVIAVVGFGIGVGLAMMSPR